MERNEKMASAPQPAIDESLSIPLTMLVKELANTIGKNLTAYVASESDESTVDRWIAGSSCPSPLVEARLRFVYKVAKPLLQDYGPAVAQAWLRGVNRDLGDRIAIDLIRHDDLIEVSEQILTAEYRFLEFQM